MDTLGPGQTQGGHGLQVTQDAAQLMGPAGSAPAQQAAGPAA